MRSALTLYNFFRKPSAERALLAEVKRKPEGSPLSREEAYAWDNRVDWPAILWLLAIGFLAGFIAVVGNQHFFRSVLFESLPMILSKTVHAVACRHIPVIGAPERQCVDQRLAQDDLFRDRERFFVPDTLVGTRQIHV